MPDTLGGFNLNTGGFTNLVQSAIFRNLLKTLRVEPSYAIPESVVPLQPVPDGSTFTRTATIWADVDPNVTTALTEGTPPSPTKFNADTLTVTVAEYGQYVPIFSQAGHQLGGLVQVAVDKVGRQIALAFDSIARGLYSAATTDTYGGSATSTATVAAGNTLTTAMVDEIVARLRERDVEPFSDGLYRIVGHPRAFKSLLAEASNAGDFANAAQFGTVGDLQRGLIGAYHGCLFVSAGSRGIKESGAGAAGIDVYKVAAFGKGSIALSDMDSISIHVVSSPSVADPLQQTLATVGWRGFLGGAIVKVANFSDGAGTIGADIQRSVTSEVAGA